ncbi:MAG: ATP-binding protein [Myxococcaceae bacterium]|nr:ATP-binding protein [Myxococcaceae bacterium]
MARLVGRDPERAVLNAALTSETGEGELIAVYGRRRVGKTFLVREFFGARLCFELVGIHGARRDVQLEAFGAALQRATGRAVVTPPTDWYGAFRLLEGFLADRLRRRRGKVVVLLDELPWLASRKSGFLEAFGHFWNTFGSRQGRLVVVLCGSAASWMIEHVVHERGGLHNRVTRRLRVEPFALPDVEALLRSRGVDLTRPQVVELAMALGGVPHYLAQVERGESSAQAIDRLCFSRDGLLRSEFPNLFASLFEQAHRHEAVVRALATRRKGLGRTELLRHARLESGGAATAVLQELEEAGFIHQLPALGQVRRDARFWLSDESVLFFLSWVVSHRGDAAGSWLRRQGTPAWRAWAGLAFEAMCLKHVRAIKRALGIAGVESVEASWAHQGSDQTDGAQVDLVIDRADRCMNLCELKFAQGPFVIDKAYAAELRRKRDVFQAATRTRKALFLTLVTTHGVKPSAWARELVAREVTVDALFERAS